MTCRAVWRAGSLPCQLTVRGEGEVGEGEGAEADKEEMEISALPYGIQQKHPEPFMAFCARAL